jgi:hypothetical protein
MSENVNYYHITPLVNDLCRYFKKYRLISVESEVLGIKLSAKDLATFRSFSKIYVVGSLKLPRTRKAKGILIKKEGRPVLNYSVSYLWEFERSPDQVERGKEIVDYRISPKYPIPKEYGNLFTDDFMLWEGFSGPGFNDGPVSLPGLQRITADDLVKDFTCDNLAGIWTPKPQTFFERLRISKLQTFGATFYPLICRQYFSIHQGSWEILDREGEKYPAIKDAVKPNV